MNNSKFMIFCFNSKLVRLKVVLDPAVLVSDAEFQFQTGSIKSETESADEYAKEIKVSIPNWFD